MPAPGIVTAANWSLEFTPGFRKVYIEQYAKIPSVMEQLYTRHKSENPYEEDFSAGAFGEPENFTVSGAINYDSVLQGFRSRYTHTEWTLGLQIQYRAYQDSKSGRAYNTLDKLPKLMATSMKRAREKRAASLFNDGATVGMTDATGPGDGVSLFNVSHPVPSGDFTWSNMGTTALSQGAIEAALIAMAEYPDDRGNVFGVNPSVLLVPRAAIMNTAREIVGTPGQTTTGNNTINTVYGSLEVIVWDYLSDANNYFLIDKDLAEMFLLWFDREEAKFMDTDFDTLAAKWAAYERNSNGYSDPRFAFGGIVA